MFFLFQGAFFYRLLAFFCFLLASLTDIYDGKIARERKEVSDFGKLMDPIADKLLVLAAFLAFVELQLVPAWMVILILIRELLVTGARFLALSKGVVLAASRGGKHKTLTQVLAVLWILFVLLVTEKTPQALFLYKSIFFVMLFTAIVTVSSGILYLFKNRSLFYGTEQRIS